jgi:uncharacterized protein (TIGR02145 family)
MKSIIRILFVAAILIPILSCSNMIVKTAEPLTDPRDGKVYQCKMFGDKVWMVENLAYQTINNSPYYASDSAKYSMYGRLYSASEITEAVNIDGWHLPDTSEWMELLAFYGLEGGNFGRGKNHYKCADWEDSHLEDIASFLSNDADGFNYKFGGLWHLKWVDQSTKRQRSFEKMGRSGYYWAQPTDNENPYSHIGMGQYKYNWIELTNEKPSSTYKSGDDFRFSIRLVKD